MVNARSTQSQPLNDHAGEAEEGSPLAYMLAVMNDEGATPARRDRMAIAAAAYLHRRAVESGIKALRQAEAQRVASTARLGRSKVPKA